MPALFSIGLSWLPEPPDARKRSAEARRILGAFEPSGEIAVDGGGRPRFVRSRADFSISHSRNAVAVAFLPAPENGSPPLSRGIPRVGCDIQYADPRKDHAAISRLFFHASEQEYIFSANGDEQRCRFYRLWALKEAWIKMHGLSVFDLRRGPPFSIGKQAEASRPLARHAATAVFLYELKNAHGELYTLAALKEPCSAAAEAPELQWFSREQPALTAMLAEIGD